MEDCIYIYTRKERDTWIIPTLPAPHCLFGNPNVSFQIIVCGERDNYCSFKWGCGSVKIAIDHCGDCIRRTAEARGETLNII
jgi:hypothetical protein